MKVEFLIGVEIEVYAEIEGGVKFAFVVRYIGKRWACYKTKLHFASIQLVAEQEGNDDLPVGYIP
jgi:hypothetical protein